MAAVLYNDHGSGKVSGIRDHVHTIELATVELTPSHSRPDRSPFVLGWNWVKRRCCRTRQLIVHFSALTGGSPQRGNAVDLHAYQTEFRRLEDDQPRSHTQKAFQCLPTNPAWAGSWPDPPPQMSATFERSCDAMYTTTRGQSSSDVRCESQLCLVRTFVLFIESELWV